jgi:hypothetical protein
MVHPAVKGGTGPGSGNLIGYRAGPGAARP